MYTQMYSKPAIDEQIQREQPEKILDDRPEPDADIPPVPGQFLFVTGIWAHFVDYRG